MSITTILKSIVTLLASIGQVNTLFVTLFKIILKLLEFFTSCSKSQKIFRTLWIDHKLCILIQSLLPLIVTWRSDNNFLRSDGHLRSDEQMVEVIRSDSHFKWHHLKNLKFFSMYFGNWAISSVFPKKRFFQVTVTWCDEHLVEVIDKWRHLKWWSLGEKWPSLLWSNDQMVEAKIFFNPEESFISCDK